MGKPQHPASSHGGKGSSGVACEDFHSSSPSGVMKTSSSSSSSLGGRRDGRKQGRHRSSAPSPSPSPTTATTTTTTTTAPSPNSPTSSAAAPLASLAIVGLVVVIVVVVFGPPASFSFLLTRGNGDGAYEEDVDDSEASKRTREFLSDFVCRYRPLLPSASGTSSSNDAFRISAGFCHPNLVPVPRRRTQHARSRIRPLEPLMRLPRSLQIWDLDALRDGFVRTELLGWGGEIVVSKAGDDRGETSDGCDGEEEAQCRPQIGSAAARHADTDNPLDSGAYLTAHLIRRLKAGRRGTRRDGQDRKSECDGVSRIDEMTRNQLSTSDNNGADENGDPLWPYLEMLPTYEDRIAEELPGVPNPHAHPAAWNISTLESFFPRHTLTFELVRHTQEMIESEYAALKRKSPTLFGSDVSFEDYLGMRINVLSRAFGAGIDVDDGNGGRGVTSLVNEVTGYDTSNFGDLYRDDDGGGDARSSPLRFRSMCPLLDMYDSHPNPNAAWRYEAQTESFVVNAVSEEVGIPPGHDVVVSYGTYTEGHLYAKYGYVNGDGSSRTEASLAVLHRVLGDLGLGRQYSRLPFELWDHRRSQSRGKDGDKGGDVERRKIHAAAERALRLQAKELLRYLQFDDGYEECVEKKKKIARKDGGEAGVESVEDDDDDWKLKLLKLQHLRRIANVREAWTVRLPPQIPDARPRSRPGDDGKRCENEEDQTRTNRERGGPTSVGVDARGPLSTCRLLSLTTADDDFADGRNATVFLENGLAFVSSLSSQTSTTPYFRVEKRGEELEYRTMMCVVRLCSIALARYGDHSSSSSNDKDGGGGNVEPKVFGSREWNAWYVRRSEVSTLRIFRGIAADGAREIRARVGLSVAGMRRSSMVVRERGPCPLELSLPLLDE